MADLRVARDFLRAWLPHDLSNRIDYSKLEMQPRSHINQIRQESEVDVLFSTTIDNPETYLYLLLEHQSKPDPLMAFRMLKYMCNIMDDHLKKHKTKQLPLIYSLVVYHGVRRYPFSNHLEDLVGASKELIGKYFLKPFQLIDLGTIKDKTLKQHAWSGVMEFALNTFFQEISWLSLKKYNGPYA